MICFPNAKINIGLNIVEKRADAYHNIETVFYPIALKDILEVVPAGRLAFHNTGIPIDAPMEKNLVVKAYRLLNDDFHINPVALHLHKTIPFGAGLGGGSSDAAFTLRLLNEIHQLRLTEERLEAYAACIGADCSFFIRNKAVFAYNKGDCFKPIKFSLRGYYMILVIPPINVSTPDAYRHVCVQKPEVPLMDVLASPIHEWRNRLVNHFESSVFTQYPAIAAIKERLYSKGALYASMSGSGSAVYGLFSKETDLRNDFEDCFYWSEYLM